MFPLFRGSAVSAYSSLRRATHTSAKKSRQDIIVVGSGCIGQGLTASLLAANPRNKVCLVAPPHHRDKLLKNGISMKGRLQGEFFPNEQFDVVSNLNKKTLSALKIESKPLVFLATKSQDVIPSLLSIEDCLYTRDPSVICLQNGIQSEDPVKLALKLLRIPVLKGHVFGAIHWQNKALHAYEGTIIIENDSSCNKKLKDCFEQEKQSIFDLKLSQNLLADIYAKIAVNCVCNPLTVIFNEPLGVLRERYPFLISLLCKEVERVAASQGIYQDDLTERVLAAMEKYAEHYSSMYLDFVAGKPTEILEINGDIFRLGYKAGFDLPLNGLLVRTISSFEKQRKNFDSIQDFYRANADKLAALKLDLLEFNTVMPLQQIPSVPCLRFGRAIAA